MKNKLLISILFASTLLLSACGSGGGDNPQSDSQTPVQFDFQTPAQTEEEVFATIEKAEKEHGSLNNVVVIPDKPNRSDDVTNVLGIDTNNNGVRDIHERIIYKGLTLIDSSTESSYDSVLSILKAIQPKDPIEENSIDRHEIYCAYEALADDIKNEFSLDSLTEMVIDTKMRRDAYYASTKPYSVSLGEERCD